MKKTWRLYTGSDGQSHIEAIDIEQKADWLKGLPTSQISFRIWPKGQFIDWHPAPRRQFVIILSGQPRSAAATAASTSSDPATRGSSKTRRARATPRAW
jgi:hypothetical protein